MTKLKSKKMTKSTFAVIIMAVVMVAMLAFGGTYAYFTAEAKDVTGTATTGYVRLTSNQDAFKSIKTNVLPGDSLITGDIVIATVATTDGSGNYVAVKVTVTAEDKEGNDVTSELGFTTITPGEDWAETTSNSGIYYLAEAVDDEGEVKISSDSFKIPASVTDTSTEEDTNGGKNLMEAVITITVETRSIQASNIASDTTPAAELAKLFA